MNHPAAPHSPTTVPSQQHQVLRTLQAAFGTEFRLWQWKAAPAGPAAGQWVGLRPDYELSEKLVESLEKTRTEDAPRLVGDDPGRIQLVLPVPPLRGPLMATAEFAKADEDWVRRQAATVRELLEQRQQNAKVQEINRSLTLQVTESFEELSFVRTLASQLQLPVGHTTPLGAAPEVLEKLRLTIRAEGLGLVPANTASEDNPIVLPLFLPSVWADHPYFDQEQCRRFMEMFRSEARDRPLIVNHVQSTTVARDFPEIRQFVMVQVGSKIPWGWLIAVNRTLDAEERKDFRVSEQEFGTVEASLMQSAASSLATYFRNIELLRQKEDLYTEVVRALVNAVEARDPYTSGHSERVALYARRLGEEIGLPGEQCRQIYLSGLLHDVGKIGVSDATLRKPGNLTDEEVQEIQRHPDQGWAILHDLQHLKDVLPGVLYHHERVDGKGYPLGLAGDAIPLEGRIMAICDAYDAMTSNRPYRLGMSQAKAEAILQRGSDKQWDPKLLDAFFSALPDIVQIRESYRPRTTPSRPAANESQEPASPER